jgi:hypothetical protein
MSNSSNDILYDRIGELLELLTREQAETIDKMIQANELDELQEYITRIEREVFHA